MTCPKCGGRLLRERDPYDPAESCVNCGYRVRAEAPAVTRRYERGDPVMSPTERRRVQRAPGKA